MKRFIRIITLILVFSMCLSLTGQAAKIEPDGIESSAYIDTVGGSISGGGKITLSFSIVATGLMTEVGAATIYIKNYSNDATVASYTYTSTSGMMGYNRSSYSGTITFRNGVTGQKYYAVVYFRSRNSSGAGTVKYTSGYATY